MARERATGTNWATTRGWLLFGAKNPYALSSGNPPVNWIMQEIGDPITTEASGILLRE